MATIDDSFFQISWGGQRLWCAVVETDASRDLVVHPISAGNSQPVQDRGRRNQKTRCTLLWDLVTGETDSPIKRFRQFQLRVAGGEELLFSHPIDGSYIAKVGENTYTIGSDDQVPTNHVVEFVATKEVESVSPITLGVPSGAGADAVVAAADELDTALMAIGSDAGGMTDKARAAALSWTNGDDDGNDIPARQILVDVAELSDLLGSSIETGGYEDDLVLWDVWRATILLGDTVRTAAISAMAETPNVFVVTIGLQPISLLVLCMRLYGGADAEDRFRQVLALNDVAHPAWLDPGSQLVMPSTTITPRTNLVRAA